MATPAKSELGKRVPMKDLVARRSRIIEATTKAAELLSRLHGSVGFSDDPEDLVETSGVQIEILARIDGRGSKIKVGKDKKRARGSALIIKRSFPNKPEEFVIIPNDSKAQAQLQFTLDDAHEVFPEEIFQHLQNAVHKNLEHRRAGIHPLKKRAVIFPSGAR